MAAGLAGAAAAFIAAGRLRVPRAQGRTTVVSLAAAIADFIQRRCFCIFISCCSVSFDLEMNLTGLCGKDLAGLQKV